MSDEVPAGSFADRNLLFGVLALQADLLDNDRFAEACSAWAVRKDTPLASLLVDRGWLQQLLGGVRIALFDGGQDAGDFAHGAQNNRHGTPQPALSLENVMEYSGPGYSSANHRPARQGLKQTHLFRNGSVVVLTASTPFEPPVDGDCTKQSLGKEE